MKILAIDTASALCSAALWQDGALASREFATAREHAQRILPMVDGLLAEAGLTLRQLDAIAFGRGPGSFTGLRIAASVTQGLAEGAGLPVVAVSDLRALAATALDAARNAGAEPIAAIGCLDARMGEVYWGAFRMGPGGVLVPDGPEAVLPPGSVPAAGPAGGGGRIAGAGRGFEAWPELAARAGVDPSLLLATAEPHAVDVARLAVRDFTDGLAVDAAEAVPVYLRDNVAHSGGLRS